MQTIWKYNAVTHLLTEHVAEDGQIEEIPPELTVAMWISRAEEQLMNIDDELTKQFRADNAIPDSDEVREAISDMAETSAATQAHKRSRAASTVNTASRKSTKKT